MSTSIRTRVGCKKSHLLIMILILFTLSKSIGLASFCTRPRYVALSESQGMKTHFSWA